MLRGHVLRWRGDKRIDVGDASLRCELSVLLGREGYKLHDEEFIQKLLFLGGLIVAWRSFVFEDRIEQGAIIVRFRDRCDHRLRPGGKVTGKDCAIFRAAPVGHAARDVNVRPLESDSEIPCEMLKR
jgi:hypothetical protein